MDAATKIIQYITLRGPVLPVQIAKEVGRDIMMASAMLSELASSKKIIISQMKVGGSPLYYLKGQEDKLQRFFDKLPGPTKDSYELLKDKGILRDIDLTAKDRAALRMIKDFAVPLDVRVGETKERFWKWYLLSNEEATPRIKQLLGVVPPVVPEKTPVVAAPVPASVQRVPEVQDPPKIQPIEFSGTVTPPVGSENFESSKVLENPGIQEKESVPEREPVVPSVALEAVETVELQPSEIELPVLESEEPIPSQTTLLSTPVCSSHFGEEKSKEGMQEEFHQQALEYFNQKEIIVNETKIIKKKTEIDFILTIPSAVGQLVYYCKARSKKKISDADITGAFVQGQLLKLPILFITNGILTKKATIMIEKELQSVTIAQIA